MQAISLSCKSMGSSWKHPSTIMDFVENLLHSSLAESYWPEQQFRVWNGSKCRLVKKVSTFRQSIVNRTSGVKEHQWSIPTILGMVTHSSWSSLDGSFARIYFKCTLPITFLLTQYLLYCSASTDWFDRFGFPYFYCDRFSLLESTDRARPTARHCSVGHGGMVRDRRAERVSHYITPAIFCCGRRLTLS